MEECIRLLTMWLKVKLAPGENSFWSFNAFNPSHRAFESFKSHRTDWYASKKNKSSPPPLLLLTYFVVLPGLFRENLKCSRQFNVTAPTIKALSKKCYLFTIAAATEIDGFPLLSLIGAYLSSQPTTFLQGSDLSTLPTEFVILNYWGNEIVLALSASFATYFH